jgi:hypothetical protein
MKKAKQIVNDEVYDAINSPPPWMIRHGLVTIFVIIVGLLISSSFIKYPETISIPVRIVPEKGSFTYPLDKLSHQYTIKMKHGDRVKAGDCLAIDSSGSKQIITPVGGIFNVSYDYEHDISVMQVIPVGGDFSIWASVSPGIIEKLKPNYAVKIKVDGKLRGVKEMNGVIGEIAQFPVNNTYAVRIKLIKSSFSKDSSPMVIGETIDCTGEVTISSVSVLSRIFKQFFHFR